MKKVLDFILFVSFLLIIYLVFFSFFCWFIGTFAARTFDFLEDWTTEEKASLGDAIENPL